MKTSLTHRLRYFSLLPDCIDWVKQEVKGTTFQSRRYEGLYEIVTGSRFKKKRTGVVIKLTPLAKLDRDTVVIVHFRTEGPFNTAPEFLDWLKKAKLKLPDEGWLHEIELDFRTWGLLLEEDGVKI